MRLTFCLLWIAMSGTAFAQQPFVHGLWVWKTASVLAAPNSGEALRDFCRAQTVNEVYLSYSPDKADATEEEEVAESSLCSIDLESGWRRCYRA